METALNAQSELVKAISKTGPVEIEGNRIDRPEAKEIMKNNRRVAQNKVIEQEFKIVGGYTFDPLDTQIIAEDIVTGKQIKVTFRDGIISGTARSEVFRALESRASIWLRLSIKEIDSEIVSAEIDRVLRRDEISETGSLTPKQSAKKFKINRQIAIKREK